jgi:hypothetical protein
MMIDLQMLQKDLDCMEIPNQCIPENREWTHKDEIEDLRSVRTDTAICLMILITMIDLGIRGDVTIKGFSLWNMKKKEIALGSICRIEIGQMTTNLGHQCIH